MPAINKTDQPIISVIITTHNQGDFIETCLDSITTQTYKHLDIICIDDHSEDDTVKIIQKFRNQDSRIRLLHGPGRGVSVARNNGLANAKGKYIMMCDGDDYYERTMCQRMLRAIEGTGVDLAICEINMIYEACREQRFYDEDYCTLRYDGKQRITSEMLKQINVFPVNKIYRKSIIDQYGLRFPVGRRYEDAAFSYAYLCVSETIGFVREGLYNYIRRPGSATAKTLSKDSQWDVAIDHIYVIIEFYKFLKEHSLFEKWAEFYWDRFRAYERLAIKFSKTKTSKKRAQDLARDFILGHMEEFTLADIDTRGAITDMTPGIPTNKLVLLKKRLLRLLPMHTTQIDNLRRLQVLSEKNTQLEQRLEDLIRRSGIK